MSISPREAMILSVVLPEKISYKDLSPADIKRLAEQFGVTSDRVWQMAAKLFTQIRSSGGVLNDCQPVRRT